MPENSEYSSARSELVTFLRHELFGPLRTDPEARQNELLSVTPTQLYGAGILFPQKHPLSEREEVTSAEQSSQADDTLEDNAASDLDSVKDLGNRSAAAGETLVEQSALNLANEYSPSALGLSVKVRRGSEVNVVITFGTYRRENRELPHQRAGETRSDGTSFPETVTRPVFIRTAHHARLVIPARESSSPPDPHEIEGTNGCLQLHERQSIREDGYVLTLMLVNTNVGGAGHVPEITDTYFQVQISLHSPTDEAVFLPIDRPSGVSPGNESASLALQYRNRRAYGFGHGCATDWARTSAVEQESVTTSVWTDAIPQYELFPVVPRQQPYKREGLNLDMRLLSGFQSDAHIGNEEIVTRLSALIADYSDWIADEEKRASQLPEALRDTAMKNLSECRTCERRMRQGVKILSTNDDAMTAFRLSNYAMLMQQYHSKLEKRISGSPPPLMPDNYADIGGSLGHWRPFQLAFVLMNIESVVNEESSEREVVDLIWFPTGGGKTEAYLGLAAMTILWRRITNRDDAGVTVLMRYTLRLLTAQQFERASALTLALELLRRSNPLKTDLGEIPISIGLWVGESLSPNRRRAAVQGLRAWKDKAGAPNPFQVLNCPWCGVAFDSKSNPGYIRQRTQEGEWSVFFSCPDSNCVWSNSRTAIPIHVIDDDIYSQPPTILLGTVDKFAQLSWLQQTGRLFGIDTPYSPPSLIIQDELHLMAGPLGTMVGLYESAISRLCERDGKIPKIVASTATIQRAEEQCLALYARSSFEFPPAAVDAGETYFAFEDRNAPGRMYVGVFASGLNSHATAQVRVCSALLQGAQSEITGPDGDRASVADTYGTLVWYFNSLRELGHAATMCMGDIPEHIKGMCKRNDIDRNDRRAIRSVVELTSRRTADEIPDVLKQLAVPWSPNPGGSYPVDVLLSTNMISVGVDVGRLGLMVITGQPKGTAEYIQASSRVGRQNPGLVVTVYNQTKSRDRSHYEQFVGYHQSLYRFVEPTSLTPFSPPARDRGFSGLLMALARHLCHIESPDSIGAHLRELENERLKLLERIGLIDEGEEDEADFELTNMIQEWQQIKPPEYGSMGSQATTVTLAFPFGSRPDPDLQEHSWPALTSMRNVDTTCEGRVILSYPSQSSSAEG